MYQASAATTARESNKAKKGRSTRVETYFTEKRVKAKGPLVNVECVRYESAGIQPAIDEERLYTVQTF